MKALILDSTFAIVEEALKAKDPSAFIDESGALAPDVAIPVRTFGVVDLWSVRKMGRSFNIYGRYL